MNSFKFQGDFSVGMAASSTSAFAFIPCSGENFHVSRESPNARQAFIAVTAWVGMLPPLKRVMNALKSQTDAACGCLSD